MLVIYLLGCLVGILFLTFLVIGAGIELNSNKKNVTIIIIICIVETWPYLYYLPFSRLNAFQTFANNIPSFLNAFHFLLILPRSYTFQGLYVVIYRKSSLFHPSSFPSSLGQAHHTLSCQVISYLVSYICSSHQLFHVYLSHVPSCIIPSLRVRNKSYAFS